MENTAQTELNVVALLELSPDKLYFITIAPPYDPSTVRAFMQTAHDRDLKFLIGSTRMKFREVLPLVKALPNKKKAELREALKDVLEEEPSLIIH